MANSRKKTHPADAANIYVRHILCEISERLGGFSKKDLEDTLKYFHRKCPYTGKAISNPVADHIEGLNRMDSGLHLYGNILMCSKDANAAKSRKSYEDFIMNNTSVLGNLDISTRKERIANIKQFIERSKYKDRKQLIEQNVETVLNKDLSTFLNEQYNTVYSMADELIAQITSNIETNPEVKERMLYRRKERVDLIAMWSKKPNLLHHKTIGLYIHLLKKYGVVTQDLMLDEMIKSNRYKNPKVTLGSMKSDSANSYGKIFYVSDEVDNILEICDDVEEYVSLYEWNYL